MVSERQEELQAKIKNLRSAAAKGETYERVVGGGAELTEEMRRSKEKFDSGDNEEQVHFLCRALLIMVSCSERKSITSNAVSQKQRYSPTCSVLVLASTP